MGRRYREKLRRQSETSSSAKNLSSDPKVVALLQWLNRQGYQESVPLRLSGFSDTGRGLMALDKIPSKKVIISIPIDLMITRNYVLGQLMMDKESSTQEAFAVFLVKETARGTQSWWSHYLGTLPASYTVPFFCQVQEIQILPKYLEQKIRDQQHDVNAAFGKMRASLFPDLDWDRFCWAWFTVNTRAVYLKGSALNIPDCLALAPFLDMFNHSSEVVVTVGLSGTGDAYEIVTECGIERFSEAFINYGPHDNLKLCLEYGFVIPNGKNTNDSVSVTIDELLEEYVDSKTDKKLEIIADQDLADKMNVHASGISWNVLACLWILDLEKSKIKDWHLVFQTDLQDTAFKSVLIPILSKKLEEIQRSLSRISEFQCPTPALEVVQVLLREHDRILSDNLNRLE